MLKLDFKSTRRHQIILLTAVAVIFAALACTLPNTISPQVEVTERPVENVPQESTTQGESDDSVSGAADIQSADGPAIPDCEAFDLNPFNGIIAGSFSFVTQDQLNNCHFESDNSFRLLIGGGKPTSLEAMQTLFEGAFGAIPGSSWEAIEDFYLGMSFSSVSVSAQGISASGHTIIIVVTTEPGPDADVLKKIFADLARESARQLNQQW